MSKSHGNTSMYVDTVINFANYHIGESWGMANDGEWRTPHFQQKWKRGHNEYSLRQLLFIHSLVVCSDLGDLPKFCSENF